MTCICIYILYRERERERSRIIAMCHPHPGHKHSLTSLRTRQNVSFSLHQVVAVEKARAEEGASSQLRPHLCMRQWQIWMVLRTMNAMQLLHLLRPMFMKRWPIWTTQTPIAFSQRPPEERELRLLPLQPRSLTNPKVKQPPRHLELRRVQTWNQERGQASQEIQKEGSRGFRDFRSEAGTRVWQREHHTPAIRIWWCKKNKSKKNKSRASVLGQACKSPKSQRSPPGKGTGRFGQDPQLWNFPSGVQSFWRLWPNEP